ncbi:MAG: efflux RND transporter permease subunit, partial [Planctomycetes bacterium]|nr:efflux RND transporter permease subunit [Planctomycetota bacterium]
LGFSILLAIGVIPLTIYRTGMLKHGRRQPLRRWFVARRRKLSRAWRGSGAGKVLAGAGIAVWECVAVFAGRNAEGLPDTPLMDLTARAYERVVRVILPWRYVISPLVMVLTVASIYWVYDAQTRTDSNQGNRDSIQLRMSFDDATDVIVRKHALRITDIEAGSAAEKGRFKVGDYVLRYNNRPVESLEDLRRLEKTVPQGVPVPIELARGSQIGSLDILGGPSGIDGAMMDTEPVRDAVWATYVLEVEDILLGTDTAAAKREKAIANGMKPELAKAMFGRTPEEAKEWFGIRDLSTSFNSGRANFWIYIDEDRVAESNEFYKRIIDAMPERAGVKVRGEFQGGSSATSEVSVRINGPETERLVQLAEEIMVRLGAVEGLEGLRIDADEGMDEVTVSVDRQRAAAFGVEPNMLTQVIGFQLSGTSLRDYQKGENLLPLRVRFAPPEDQRGNPHDPGLQDVAETRIA